jgi:putative transposase
MRKITTSDAQVVEFRRDIQELLRGRIREAIEVVLEEELTDALGSSRHERSEKRRGYRNGHEQRRVTTGTGLQELRVPRGRLHREDGTTKEHRSEVLPRYARRTKEVDEAILGAYLAGANSRRIRKALGPLLGQEHLSKSAVSRVVTRLKGHFQEWSHRDLSGERYVVLFLDGFHLKVRLARRVVSVPVLAALGVAPDGSKRLVSLCLAVSESSHSWGTLIEGLVSRGLAEPMLLVTDGHAGLKKAAESWPDVQVQRCTIHKLHNLQEHCPRHARRELKRDYDAIIYATDGMAARKQYESFVAKWSKLCPAVERSIKEAGEQLLTFYSFPKAMWKCLRTTNAVENLNREFRRRTKTQGSFSNEDAALTLLYGLVAFGQIEMRRISGYRHVALLIKNQSEQAA